jgi:hypothetical protein
MIEKRREGRKRENRKGLGAETGKREERKSTEKSGTNPALQS